MSLLYSSGACAISPGVLSTEPTLYVLIIESPAWVSSVPSARAVIVIWVIWPTFSSRVIFLRILSTLASISLSCGIAGAVFGAQDAMSIIASPDIYKSCLFIYPIFDYFLLGKSNSISRSMALETSSAGTNSQWPTRDGSPTTAGSITLCS